MFISILGKIYKTIFTKLFKTIFSKLLGLFIVIIIISFSVTGVMLFYFLDNYVYAEKERQQIKYAESISNALLTVYLPNMHNTPFGLEVTQRLNLYLELLSQQTNSIIWVVSESGEIVFYSPDISKLGVLRDKLTDESGKLRLPDKRQYTKIMLSGQDIVVEKGNFYGLFEGQSYLVIEKSMKYIDSSGKEKIVGAVYLCLDMPQVYRLQRTIYNYFIMSAAVSILLAIILAYVFSRRITKPLKQINNAAKVIANGEFEKRLNIDSTDEIGELAVSFNNMVTALENLEEMRRGFIANVSHELRTPMTSIRGFIEGIMDGTVPPEKHNVYLAIVRDEVNRMNRLVNNLLDLARMEAGENKLKKSGFNINELLRRSIIKVESLILQKNINVEAVFEVEDMYANADIDAIERVVINLVHNAIKFTPEGGKITVSTRYFKGRLQVSVEDNGIGISRDEINLIWDRFYKSDKSRGKDKTGTGLGLAIVKNIISDHGQEIWVESEQGKGTKFTFTLEKSEEKTV